MPTPSGHPSEIPKDRGTVDRPNENLLSVHLRHALQKGEITAADFADWLTKPWMALHFLEGRISPKSEVIRTNPINVAKRGERGTVPDDALVTLKMTPTPLSGPLAPVYVGRHRMDLFLDSFGPDSLRTLQDWSRAAERGTAVRERWENNPANRERVKQAKAAVDSMHAMLAGNLEVMKTNEKNLNVSKELNSVEFVFDRSKQYLLDDFHKHPASSVGLVVFGVMFYKMIKHTRLWHFTKWGLALWVGGSFLKSQFGVQPTEKIAELIERYAGKDMADAFRKGRDTLLRGAFGPEGKGALNHYYYDKLALHREEPRTAFNFLLRQNPKKFMAWYNMAERWRIDRRGKVEQVPAEMQPLIREMESMESAPPFFKKMNDVEKAEHLLGVADKVFLHIAERNKKGRNSSEGLAIVRQKYVDGKYFDLLWSQYDTFFTALEKKHAGTPMLEQIARIRLKAKGFCERMRYHIEHGSDVITFMDVLMMESDLADLRRYEGEGVTLDRILATMGDIVGYTKEQLKKLGKQGMVVLKEIDDYLRKDVVEYWTKQWAKFEAFLAGPEVDKWIKDITKWYDGLDLPGKIQKAKETGEKIIISVKDSPVAALLKEIGVQAGEAIELTLEQAMRLAEWMREHAELSEHMRKMEFEARQVPTAAGISRVSAVVKKPADGYRYILHVKLVLVSNTDLNKSFDHPMKSPSFITGAAGTQIDFDPAPGGNFPIVSPNPAYSIKRVEAQVEVQHRSGRVTKNTNFIEVR